MDYYSAIKGNELLIHAIWINLNAKWKKPYAEEYILYDSTDIGQVIVVASRDEVGTGID